MSNLSLNLVATARRIPKSAAAITDDEVMNYRQLDTASSRFATLFAQQSSYKIGGQPRPAFVADVIVLYP